MLTKKKFTRIVSLFAVGITFLGLGSQVTHARRINSKLGSSQVAPSNPIAKKGQKIFVIVQDTKSQKVPVVNSRNRRTGKKVKMGTVWKVRATKKVKKTRIYKISGKNRWLRSRYVTKY